jgi:hypothetical protein
VNDDLVHDPRLFDSRSWLVLAHGYKALQVELETKTGALRPERASSSTQSVTVKVRVLAKGRTSPRQVFYYGSLNRAIQQHGRRVRSSIDTGRPVDGIKAEMVTHNRKGVYTQSAT